MKNNASFLIVTATALAAMALCFGSIAEFDTATPQIASATTQSTDAVSATHTDATLRIE